MLKERENGLYLSTVEGVALHADPIPNNQTAGEALEIVACNEMRWRALWSLTAERVVKSPDGLDLAALLDRLESEMPTAPPQAQWTMNACLVEIGVHNEEHRERALAIGEALGLYSDYPVSKGCTSPFAPIWINHMVSRQ